MITFWCAITSDKFSAFATLCGLIGDAATLFLTIYTLHITAFSRKLKLVTITHHLSNFWGEGMTFTLMNKSLHAIPVQKVFVLKRSRGRFYYVGIKDYKNPIAIDSWNMKNIEMDPFTSITRWPDKTKDGFNDYHSITEDSVIGVRIGDKITWVKPVHKSPLRAAKKAYKEDNIIQTTVSRTVLSGHCLSKAVDCEIRIVMQDLNGQKYTKDIFGISTANGGKSLLLSDYLFGHNGIEGAGHTAESITDRLSEAFNIKRENISVRMINQTLI